MHDHDGLVAVRLVRGEPGLHDHRIDAAPPIARDEVNLQPQPASHLAPQRGEVTGLEHEHGIAGRECIDQRRLPCAGAGSGVDDDGPGGLEDLPEALEYLQRQPRKLGAAVIDRRMIQRAQDPIGDVGGSGNLQKMAATGMIVEAKHGTFRARSKRLLYTGHAAAALQDVQENASE